MVTLELLAGLAGLFIPIDNSALLIRSEKRCKSCNYFASNVTTLTKSSYNPLI
jgi:hypothetical protein